MESLAPGASRRGRWAPVLLAVSGLSSLAFGDRLVTSDSRVLELQKARQLPDGSYFLAFEHGDITCPARFVASVEMEGDMSGYVPQNDDEREKLAQGYVRYKGKWMSKPAYQVQLKREGEQRRARTEELAAHSTFDNPWSKETKHYVIQTDTSPELLEHYAELLEAYWNLMSDDVGVLAPRLGGLKMQVDVYKSYEEFFALNHTSPGVAGFFDPFKARLCFFHDYLEPETSNWLALHEGTHLLTSFTPGGWGPLWLSEGTADYFGSAKIARSKDGRLRIEPGQLQLDRILTVQEAIHSGTNLRLNKLFSTASADFSEVEYAHAWSLILFLNTDARYAAGFRRFFRDVYARSRGPREEFDALLIERIGAHDLGALEEQWISFVSSLPIDGPAAHFKRGLRGLLAGQEDGFARALEDLDEAVAAGIEDPRAFMARGLLRMIQEKELADAIVDLGHAVELAPLDPTYRFLLGLVLRGKVQVGSLKVDVGQPKDESPDRARRSIEKARLHLGLACDLDPENDQYRESYQSFLKYYETHEHR